MVYLDYTATTPVNPEVLESFNKVCTGYIGNPNSLHRLGVEAHLLEDSATSQISKLLNLDDYDIIYTSGASEANNTVLKGIASKYSNRGKKIITSALEHSSINEPLKYLESKGFEIIYCPTNNGVVDLDALDKLIDDKVILVSITHVNSETGVTEPINEIGKIVHKRNTCFFHTDITQSIGKINIDFTNVDFASMSAHKIYGMKGIGLLIKKENIQIEPLIHGGKSTTAYRSGTPALPLIVSLMKAMELVTMNMHDNYEYVSKLNKMVCDRLKTYPLVHINSTKNSIPNTINFSLRKIKPETFLHALDQHDIYISTKSACSSANSMSNAVYALTKDKELSNHSLRISLSYKTTEEEIDMFFKVFDECYKKLDM